MRRLVTTAILTSALFACGQSHTNSQVADDSAVPAAATATGTYTWKVSFLNGSDQGTVQVAKGGAANITVHGLTADSRGDMTIQLLSGSTVAYTGTIKGMVVIGGAQLRRVDMIASTGYSLPAANNNYCGSNNNFNNNFDNNEFDNQFDSQFDNSNFNDGRNNDGRFGSTFNDTPVTTTTTTDQTGQVAPRSADFQVELDLPN